MRQIELIVPVSIRDNEYCNYKARELIRCADCKYRIGAECHKHGKSRVRVVFDFDYCSEAERK